MKHIFIVNPAAGLINRSQEAVNYIERVFTARGLEHFTFITEYPNHGYELVKKMCEFFNGETIRFYACGGMGTLSEIINAVPSFNDIQVTMYPIGFKNDFARVLGRKERDFLNIEALIDGEPQKIDLMRVNGHYVINAACIGCCAKVSADMQNSKLRKLGLFNRSLPYILPILKNIVFSRVIKTLYNISVDGKKYDGRYAMLSFMNNNTYGTMFSPRPDATPDDGIINALFTTAGSRFQMISNMSMLREGTLVSNTRISLAVNGKIFKIKQMNGQPMMMDVDGETIKPKDVTIEMVPQAIDFIMPKIWSVRL